MDLLPSATSNPSFSVAEELKNRTGSFKVSNKPDCPNNKDLSTIRNSYLGNNAALILANSTRNKDELRRSTTVDVNINGKFFTDISFNIYGKHHLLNQTMTTTTLQSNKLVSTKYVNGLIQYCNDKATKFKVEKQALEKKIKAKIAIRNQSKEATPFKNCTPIKNDIELQKEPNKAKDIITATIEVGKTIEKRSLTPEGKKTNKLKQKTIKTYEYRKRKKYSYKFTPGKGCIAILVLFNIISNRQCSLCIWLYICSFSNINSYHSYYLHL